MVNQPQKIKKITKPVKVTVKPPEEESNEASLSSLTKLKLFFKKHWIGTLVILLATIIFFLPMIVHLGSYSEGGDAMFNAWTLARDQHCVLRQNCPSYANGNIYFPHNDTMLYSETQLSAGVLTLPLYLINQNPIFSYNVWTILSFLFSGWFMYLLAKRLSKNNEAFSLMAGLIFEFAPLKMAAYSHLQNLSIFYLPLAVLFILKYLDSKKRRYLAFLFIALALQFYASWYQMIFVLVAVGLLIVGLLIARLYNWRKVLWVGAIVLLAAISTYPLAKQYVQFSKSQQATFTVTDQVTYSSSVADYLIPTKGTLIGNLYYHIRPHAKVNSYDPDSFSYHGIVLYAVALALLITTFVYRRKSKEDSKRYKLILIFLAIGLVGFIMSLGPLLKLKSTYIYPDVKDGLQIVIPLPWLLVDKFLPQLSFIRAIGRASVILLFSLCCMLAIFPVFAYQRGFFKKYRKQTSFIIAALVIIELAPIHLLPITHASYSHSYTIPAVYKFIKNDKNIGSYVDIYSDKDYPGATIPIARAETALWAGYDNKNVFNGYSGYTPPQYFTQIDEFDVFQPGTVALMKAQGIQYVLVDKQLSTSDPGLVNRVAAACPDKVYEDTQYALFKLP